MNWESIGRRDIDKLEKVKALREASKRVNLGPDNLPSICFYTLINSPETWVISDMAIDPYLYAFLLCLVLHASKSVKILH